MLIKRVFKALIALSAVALYSIGSLLWAADVEWTRLKGTVKSINLKASTLMIVNSDGDPLTIPIDYQVKIIDKKNTIHRLQDTELDSKITLIRTISEKPVEEADGLLPYRGMDGSGTDQEPKKKK